MDKKTIARLTNSFNAIAQYVSESTILVTPTKWSENSEKDPATVRMKMVEKLGEIQR